MNNVIKKVYCKRCERGKLGWFPRKPGRVRICPFCKNPNYDTPPQEKPHVSRKRSTRR